MCKLIVSCFLSDSFLIKMSQRIEGNNRKKQRILVVIKKKLVLLHAETLLFIYKKNKL